MLRKIISERLGRDCEELFDEVTTPEMTGDDYEKIADGYRSMLQDTLTELEAALTQFDMPRLNKAKLQKQLQAIKDNLHKNL